MTALRQQYQKQSIMCHCMNQGCVQAKLVLKAKPFLGCKYGLSKPKKNLDFKPEMLDFELKSTNFELEHITKAFENARQRVH